LTTLSPHAYFIVFYHIACACVNHEILSRYDEPTLATLKAEIANYSTQLADLRKEVRLCDRITTRTVEVQEKIRKAADEQLRMENGELRMTKEKAMRRNDRVR